MAELVPAERDDKQTPGFHVFSIRTKAEAHSSNASEADTKRYITRKSHRKSRLGCLACKVKRVKVERVSYMPKDSVWLTLGPVRRDKTGMRSMQTKSDALRLLREDCHRQAF